VSAPYRTRHTALLVLAVALISLLSTATAPGATLATPESPAPETSGWELVGPEGAVSTGFCTICSFDAQTSWAVFTDYPNLVETTFMTSDGGQNWSPLRTREGYMFGRVSALDQSVAWASAFATSSAWEGEAGAFGAVIEKTGDGGANWSTLCLLPNIAPLKLIPLNAEDLWMLGVEITDAGKFHACILRSSDGGRRWTRQYTSPQFWEYGGTPSEISPLPLLPYWFDMDAADADTAWAAILGNIIKSEDGGNSWTTQVLKPSFEFELLFHRVSAVDPLNAWAACGPEILRTCDGGTVWTSRHTVAGGEVADIAAVDGHTAWAARVTYDYYYPLPQGGPVWMLPHEGEFLKTVDGGETWTPQYPPETCSPIEIISVDAASAWAAGVKPVTPPASPGNGVVLRTTGGGDARPDIVSLAPGSAPAGGEITIAGRDFGETQGASRVLFGDVEATGYASWSDTHIRVAVPRGTAGAVEVRVMTPQGTSNPVPFRPLAVTSVSPASALQFAVPLNLKIDGSGFQPGARVKLVMGASIIHAASTRVIDEHRISAALYFVGVAPGVYDVVVANPDGGEDRLQGGFTVNAVCGSGSGTALLVLGASLGLLSLAGSRRLRKLRQAGARKR
jgi:photosystem II stability/assembly factor-like uncharacterized protein